MSPEQRATYRLHAQAAALWLAKRMSKPSKQPQQHADHYGYSKADSDTAAGAVEIHSANRG